MNTSVDRVTRPGHAENDRHSEAPPSDLLVLVITALLAIALALAAWLVVTTGSTSVAAAPVAEQSPTVPYFPSQYVNQATEPSLAPPTF